MHKTSSEARKERQKKLQEEQDRIDGLKDEDLDQYIKGLYDQRKEILERIDSRKRKAEQITKRGSLANKKRIQAMAGMIEVNENENQTHHQPGKEKNDEFGMADEDWDIYRGLNKDHMDEDEEDLESTKLRDKQQTLIHNSHSRCCRIKDIH